MVNLAYNARSTLRTAKELEGTHGAYLSCTEALIPDLEAIFKKRLGDPQIKHILFTGESSGGAVSSLLFFHFASQCIQTFEGTDFSLITFGCPPVTAQDVTIIAERLPNTRIILSFVNEGDFVTLASAPYVQSMINLFRHTRGLKMIGDPAGCEAQAQAVVQEQGPSWSNDTRVREWKLPEPKFYQIGKIVVLTSSLVNRTLLSPGCLELKYCDFARLLFCDIEMHKGREYGARIGALAGKDPVSYGNF
uniref:Fungal lipase-type domain-containing protein n=1 Tax=Gibberella zeae TaxID=5518 RepID=A0A4E9DU58_GIBZA